MTHCSCPGKKSSGVPVPKETLHLFSGLISAWTCFKENHRYRSRTVTQEREGPWIESNAIRELRPRVHGPVEYDKKFHTQFCRITSRPQQPLRCRVGVNDSGLVHKCIVMRTALYGVAVFGIPGGQSIIKEGRSYSGNAR
jgi:hypothetical protein